MSTVTNISGVFIDTAAVAPVLPSPYTAIAGKSRGGSAYVNTGVVLDTNDFEIELIFKYPYYGDSASPNTFPILLSSESGLGSAGQIGFCNRSDSTRGICAVLGSNTLTSELTRKNNNEYYLRLTYKDNTATFVVINRTSGETDTKTAQISYPFISETVASSLYVFGSSEAGYVSDGYEVSLVRVKKNGNLVLSSVFAINSNDNSEYGLYNLLTNTLIQAAGTLNTAAISWAFSPFFKNKYITSVDLSQTPCKNNSLEYCFFSCSNLVSVANLNNNITNMCSTFSGCSNLVNIPTIPNSVADMSQCFSGCKSITEVPTIPNSVTNMAYSFYNCSNLVSTNGITIPDSVTDIDWAFYGCNNLVDNITIGNNVTTVYGTFENCFNLVNAPVIPNNATNISIAFRNCTNLTGDVYIQSSNVTNAMYCFNGTSLSKNVHVPANSATYNAFVAAGYDDQGTKEGVTLIADL